MTSAAASPRLRRDHPFEGVEDEVEADLELVAEVVTRPQHVLDGELRQVRIVTRRRLGEDLLREVRGLSPGLERQARLLQRETVDIAVKQCVGMCGLLDREAGGSQTAEYGVVV